MSADRHNMSHGKQKYMQLCCTPRDPISTNREARFSLVMRQLNGSVKEPNMFHNYETDKITRKASDVAEYIELFGSFTRDRHARRI